MYRIYYIKNNDMFRHFTLAVFRLSGEVRGEVGTHFTSYLPTVYNPHKSSIAAY